MKSFCRALLLLCTLAHTLEATGCFKYKIDFYGSDLQGGRKYGVYSAESCQKLCQKTTGCKFFAWHNAKSSCCPNNCFLKSAKVDNRYCKNGECPNPVVTSGPRDCVCQSGWTLNTDNCRCFKFISRSDTWTKANMECQRIAPTNSDPRSPPVTARHLAAPQSQRENDFLADLTGGKPAWIGGFKFADGNWGWTDGQKWGAFINWRRGGGRPDEPNNRLGKENSIVMNWSGRGLWNDAPFGDRYAYVCQYLDLTKPDVQRGNCK